MAKIDRWNEVWESASLEWQNLKTRVVNLISVHDGTKQKSKLSSIKNLTLEEETNLIRQMLKSYITTRDDGLNANELMEKYRSELEALCTFDKDTKDTFGYVNTWWVFSKVSDVLGYEIFMAEVDNIGYKRYKKNKSVCDKPMPNELFRTTDDGKILIDDNIEKTILDNIRNINWE